MTKLLFVCMFCMSVMASARSYTQTKVSLQLENVKLQKALLELQKVSHVKLLFSEELLKSRGHVSLVAYDRPFKEVLSQLLFGTGLDFTFIDSSQVAVVPYPSILFYKLEIDGRITDLEGKPIEGATIIEKGSTNGTTSDSSGFFNLLVKDSSAIIQISRVGFQSIEIPVSSLNHSDIKLTQSKSDLNEVVVVGYGSQRKANLTGSLATVTGDVLKETPSSNLTNSIAGRLPGVIATNSNGAPGAGSTLQIRGLSTMNDNTALVVIDGVVRQDGFGSLDPNEIETITILKDASSASVYGARAANGVFLITTKRGKTGKPTITYSGMVGIQNPTNYPKIMSASQFATLRNKALINQGFSPTDPAFANRFYTDSALKSFQSLGSTSRWYDESFKNNSLQNSHNLTMSGGNEYIRYFNSVSYLNQNGMYDNINYKRFNFRSNIESKITKTLTVTLNLEGREEKNQAPGVSASSIFAAVLRQNPIYPAYNKDGTYFNTTGENPVAQIKSSGYNNNTLDVFSSALSFDQKLNFITKGLSLTGMMSFYKDRLFAKSFLLPYNMYTPDASGNANLAIPAKVVGGTNGQKSLSEGYKQNNQQFYNIALNYTKSINKSNFKGLLVYEKYKSYADTLNAMRQDFVTNQLDQLNASGTNNQTIYGSSFINDTRRSLVGRINYNYDSRYLLEFTFRRDGSYRFPSDKRWGFFPAMSAGWRISEESFFKNSEALHFINDLKLRVSTGKLGNDRVNAFQYADNYLIVTGKGPVIGGTSVPYVVNDVYPNPNITWEKQTNNNIGIDVSMFNSKLTWSFDYFNRVTKDILRQRLLSIPGTFGRDLPDENYAKMKSYGWETNITYQNNFGDFNWSINGNVSFAANKVTEIDVPAGALDYQNPLNKTFGYLFGYQALGIFKTQQEADSWMGGTQFGLANKAGDIKYADVNGNNSIDIQDQKVLSNYSNTPRIIYGLSNTLTWKGFDLNVLIQGAAQSNIILSGTARVTYANGGASNNFAYLNDSWTPDNVNAKFPLAWVDARSMNDRNSSFWLRKAGYARLKTLNIGYTISNNWIKSLGISRIRVYASGFNLITWSQLKEFDPELATTTTATSDVSISSAGLYYPQQKNYNLGINVTF